MYDHTSDDMVNTNVAELCDVPVWIDKDGKEVKEEDAFDCKVTHCFTRPDYCFVIDDVGGNINQIGNENVGGQLQMCEVVTTLQQKVNSRDKHYTLLGITALTGEPVMCIVIFSGKRHNPLWETGLDLEAETIGSTDDDDFFEKTVINAFF